MDLLSVIGIVVAFADEPPFQQEAMDDLLEIARDIERPRREERPPDRGPGDGQIDEYA